MYKIVNKLYNWFLNISPIAQLKEIKNCDIIIWASDLTHLREQIHVIQFLEDYFRVGLISNKKTIRNYIKNNTNHSVGFLLFGKNTLYSIDKILLKKNKELKYALIGNDLRQDDNEIAKALINHKIPYGVISHGLIPDIITKSKANHFFVWSRLDKDKLIKLGIEQSRIIITGSPYLNTLNKETVSIKNLNLDATLQSDKIKVLVALSGPGDQYSELEHITMLENINKLAFNLKETHIFFSKLHKKDNPKYYYDKPHLHVIPENEIPANISRLVPLLKKIDIIITGASASIIEGIFLHKTVIIYDPYHKTQQLPFVNGNYVTCCESISQVLKVIEVLKDENYKRKIINKQTEFIEQFFALQPPPAITIANHIKSFLKDTKSER